MEFETHDQIKVIGAGLGRTGTRSLRDALNILGFKCSHMITIRSNPQKYAKLWYDIAAARESQGSVDVDWDSIFKMDNFEATVDEPSSLFYKDLMQYYPNAKVILTVRDSPDVWYKSAHNTIYHLCKVWDQSMYYWVRRMIFPSEWYWHEMVFKLVWGRQKGQGIYQGEFGSNPAKIKKIYSDWIEDVKSHVPEDKLLVLNMKQNGGKWDALCTFLNVQEPKDANGIAVPFPFANTSKDKQKEIEKLKRNDRIWKGTMLTAVVCGAGYGVYRYLNCGQTQNSNPSKTAKF